MINTIVCTRINQRDLPLIGGPPSSSMASCIKLNDVCRPHLGQTTLLRFSCCSDSFFILHTFLLSYVEKDKANVQNSFHFCKSKTPSDAFIVNSATFFVNSATFFVNFATPPLPCTFRPLIKNPPFHREMGVLRSVPST